MVSLSWCKKQNGGISLGSPNDNLSLEYLRNAEETLEVLKEIGGKSNMWLATTKYYFEYFCLYSILMKFGIKCEIHDCTIEVGKLLWREEIISKQFYFTIHEDKGLRIENQYYLKNKKVEVDYDFLNSFLFETKDILNKITLDKINAIRKYFV